MADGDRTDYWAPNSDLDSDPNDPGRDYVAQSGLTVNVKVNDWLDLDDKAIPLDPLWGSSFQVLECHEEEIIVRMYDAVTDLYQPMAVSPSLIMNNYRRVPQV